MINWLFRKLIRLDVAFGSFTTSFGNISVSSDCLISNSLVGRRALLLIVDGTDEQPTTIAGRSAQEWATCNLRGRKLSPLASGQQSARWRSGMSARPSGGEACFPAASLSGFLNIRARYREIDASDAPNSYRIIIFTGGFV